MNKPLINQTHYKKLVSAIRNEIVSAERDIKNRLILMYYGIGKHISKDILKYADRAGYGKALYKKLSKTLHKSASALYKATRFYEMYPILEAPPKLKWTHYQLLIRIESDVLRAQVEEKAIRKKLVTRQLREEVKKAQAAEKPAPKTVPKTLQNAGHPKYRWAGGQALQNADPPKLRFTRGQLYHYQIISAHTVTPAGAERNAGISTTPPHTKIDVGFKVARSIPVTPQVGSVLPDKWTNGSVVISKKSRTKYTLTLSDTNKKYLYTYIAWLQKVIDGDTLAVEIDLGFDTTHREHVRLKGINTPEIATLAGKKAKAFVKRQLSQVDFFIIKTYGYGKYDRPLTDIFYLPGENDPEVIAEKGIFLNQELLDKSLAEKVS